jgi:hypothetical protein
MFPQDGYHTHEIYPRRNIKRSTKSRLVLSRLQKQVKCGDLSIDLLKERLDFLPANSRTEEDLELSVPYLEEVYPVIKFFSSSDIRHFAFERVSFIGEVYYRFKPTQEDGTIAYTDYPVLANYNNCHSGPSLYIIVRLPYSVPVVEELYTRDIDQDLILDLYKS